MKRFLLYTVISLMLFGIFGWINFFPKIITLPILNPEDIDPNLIDTASVLRNHDHRIPDFKFQNQENRTITQDEFRNKIYVANFFFTTCPSICPTLIKHTKLIQNEFIDDDDILLISHTVYPEHDSVQVLYDFAELNGINSEKWHLVTGKKDDIYELSRKGYFAISYNPSRGKDAFIHTENVVLIDKERRIRGIYTGTKLHETNRLIEDIYTLRKEYMRNSL
jgi:protein SCO1/2